MEIYANDHIFRDGAVGPYMYFTAEPTGANDVLFSYDGSTVTAMTPVVNNPQILGTVG